MIVLRVQGGLGNQMFQYAFGRYLADARGIEVRYDTSSFTGNPNREYTLPVWCVEAPTLSDTDLRLIPRRYGGVGIRALLEGKFPLRRVRERKPYRFQLHYSHVEEHSYLDGYWQSEQFFPGMRNQLQEEFRPAKPLSKPSAEVLRTIERCPSVAVHVRLTDYLDHPEMQTCGLGYYEHCLRELRERYTGLEVFVFSDDIPWCRKHLRLESTIHFVDHNRAGKEHEDLWLMSRCRHHVIPNSSFSWWAAWLKEDQGEVFAPSPWFAEHRYGGNDIPCQRWNLLPGKPALARVA